MRARLARASFFKAVVQENVGRLGAFASQVCVPSLYVCVYWKQIFCTCVHARELPAVAPPLDPPLCFLNRVHTPPPPSARTLSYYCMPGVCPVPSLLVSVSVWRPLLFITARPIMGHVRSREWTTRLKCR
jgi:hypothetical protein